MRRPRSTQAAGAAVGALVGVAAVVIALPEDAELWRPALLMATCTAAGVFIGGLVDLRDAGDVGSLAGGALVLLWLALLPVPGGSTGAAVIAATLVLGGRLGGVLVGRRATRTRHAEPGVWRSEG